MLTFACRPPFCTVAHNTVPHSLVTFPQPPDNLQLRSGMLEPGGPCGLEAKSFSLGLTLSGLSLVEIGLVASNIYSAHDIN